MKLKQKYIKFKLDGVLYDFTNYDEERLKRLWDNNPNLRYLFEPIEAELPVEVSREQPPVVKKSRRRNEKKKD